MRCVIGVALQRLTGVDRGAFMEETLVPTPSGCIVKITVYGRITLDSAPSPLRLVGAAGPPPSDRPGELWERQTLARLTIT